jgi:alpha-tubulin suppressor-like RCC1 family protein
VLALNPDQTVTAWGRNVEGQLGGTLSPATPSLGTTVTGLIGITGVSAGRLHSLARKSDGTAWAWGNNAQGQLGDGTVNHTTTAFQIPPSRTFRPWWPERTTPSR